MNEYVSYRLASILCRLFPEKLAYWFGLRISDLFYARNHVGRQAIISNLKRIYAARGVVRRAGTGSAAHHRTNSPGVSPSAFFADLREIW